MKNEKDRMRELVEMFSKKNEIFVSEEKETPNADKLKTESDRLKTLASGKANADFKENYMGGSEYGMNSRQGKTVNSIVDQMYDNPTTTGQPIRQPIQADEGLELAIRRALKSGSPINDMGLYDEINWHLMSLGFPAKNALDIKNGLVKYSSQK